MKLWSEHFANVIGVALTKGWLTTFFFIKLPIKTCRRIVCQQPDTDLTGWFLTWLNQWTRWTIEPSHIVCWVVIPWHLTAWPAFLAQESHKPNGSAYAKKSGRGFCYTTISGPHLSVFRYPSNQRDFWVRLCEKQLAHWDVDASLSRFICWILVLVKVCWDYTIAPPRCEPRLELPQGHLAEKVTPF